MFAFLGRELEAEPSDRVRKALAEMADSVKPATEVPKQAASAAPVPKIPSIPKSDGNPVFRMMGKSND